MAEAIFGFFSRFGFNSESINKQETRKRTNRTPPSIIFNLGIMDIEITPSHSAINNAGNRWATIERFAALP
jgi:hypothetical protein